MSDYAGSTPRRLRPLAAALVALVIASAGLVAVTARAASAEAPPEHFYPYSLAQGPTEVGEPIAFDPLPDGSVLHTSRDGVLRLTDYNGRTSIAAQLPVYTHDEDGLQGVAVDPGFTQNRWVYLYYAPRLSTPLTDAPTEGDEAAFAPYKGYNQLSRFKLSTGGVLDMASEQKILQVPADRGICCHVGGDIEFDTAGNLLLATGDDSNPFQSSGNTPIDERPQRNPAFDAQRTSANSNDLRGKLLRIKVADDGTYSVPEGNMFPAGTAKTKPEIYAMGFRNPFKISVDRRSGAVFVGDYGPDKSDNSTPERGPLGQVEFARVTGPGFFGWPYCTGNNTPEDTYGDYDFATGTVGPKFDCQNGPANDSPNNTGITQLPKPVPAWIRYSGCDNPDMNPPTGCSQSESPMMGPIYQYDAASTSQVKFPAEYDGLAFLGEFERRWIKTAAINADGSPGTISSFPWPLNYKIMDLEFGPDGALYILTYGEQYFASDDHAGLFRMEHIGTTGRRPEVKVSADRTSGRKPLRVRFSSAGTFDPEGTALTYKWDFGDGTTSTTPNPRHTYTKRGQFTPTLTVTDASGKTATDSLVVTVGNTAPQVTLKLPRDGQLVNFGDAVPYRIVVRDAEDSPVDCSKVKLTYLLGHATHQHALAEQPGCSGVLQTPDDGDHGAGENIYGVWAAEYTDNGGRKGVVPLQGTDVHITQPKHRQAEHYKAHSGITTANRTGAHGQVVTNVQAGDWIMFEPYWLGNVSSFTARVATGGTAGTGGTLELRAGSPDGTLLGSAAVPGGGTGFFDVTGTVSGAPREGGKLYLVFTGGTGTLFEFDDFTFTTTGS
ncbi:PQQ-dependent sugar dehydrogenase [Actinomadura rudentiformis]|uniref:Carbohydrate-binding protein n=1 Tax=Actinomadura rudentiformis TaxID=359158 RepID=A0A6H9YUW4_9ACTN|nr:PQQ-dependent sugar dehydrogenase [Actinomadura rudentiformis]KAB2352397.1 carbohydrate-binding protein [Actinomadura rudentiformis]